MADLGEYYAATDLIGGSASGQNLLAINNPGGSGVNVLVKLVRIQACVTVVATTAFLHRMQRLTALATGGTVLTAQQRFGADTAPAAVVRSLPTSASASAGQLWAGTPGATLGSLVSGALMSLSDQIAHDSRGLESEDLMLAPGQAIGIFADANLTTWNHVVRIGWRESTR